jgi:hypothetical protein
VRFASQALLKSPSQLANPVLHGPTTHSPPRHSGAAFRGVGHSLPQAPQFDGSSSRFVSQPSRACPLQSPRPSLQIPDRHWPATQAPRPASSTQLTEQPPQWFALWRSLEHFPSQHEKPDGQGLAGPHTGKQRPSAASHEDPSGQSASFEQPTHVCVTVSQTRRGPPSPSGESLPSLASEALRASLASEAPGAPPVLEPSRAPPASAAPSRAASSGARASIDASLTDASAPESRTMPASTDAAPTQSAFVLQPGSQRWSAVQRLPGGQSESPVRHSTQRPSGAQMCPPGDAAQSALALHSLYTSGAPSRAPPAPPVPGAPPAPPASLPSGDPSPPSGLPSLIPFAPAGAKL